MKYKKDSLGDRMKGYEQNHHSTLTKRIPVILRCDGRAFHTITRKYFKKGYDENFVSIMVEVAKYLQTKIQGCSLVYCQSDEISCLLTDYRTIKTSGWFDYDLNKVNSISASLCSSKFTQLTNHLCEFDARAFTVPNDDVCNYFLWRQQDATRNAIQMAGREYFSQKQVHQKNTNEIQEMLFQEHQINFSKYPTIRKRGFCVVDGEVDYEIPIFSQDRGYIEKFVNIRED